MESNSTDDSKDETKNPKTMYDPGWNDPPLFSFDAVNITVQSRTNKKTLLNKRVAFPMSSQQPSSYQATSATIPPTPPNSSRPPTIMPPISGHTIKNVVNASEVPDSSQNLQSEDGLQKVLLIFEEILTSSSEELKQNCTEIRRRLDVMKKMWEENKLKPEICLKMVQLSEALSSGNIEQADRIHMGLMVDHVSLCSPWMAGVRHLIHQAKSNQSTDNEKHHESSEGVPLIST